MTYQQTIDYLYTHLPMFSRIGEAAYKEDLHNTISLCEFLGNPHQKFKCIHIAGTNGKGSTSHMLAAILQKAGYKTGLYTSPHLKDFRERIKINGTMIKESFVIDFVEKTDSFAQKIQPSFFELTVAMAFDYFAQEQVDIAVIETGLGGRLDSTNVIQPILSVITNIGWDHMNILGNQLDKIAFEKAGIIKPGVPVVIGEYLPETKQVFIEKAKQANSSISFVQDIYKITAIALHSNSLQCQISHITTAITETFTLDLCGQYQAQNLCTVLCAEGILIEQGFQIKQDQEKFALSHVKSITGFYGRWDILSEQPITIADVAHNVDGLKQVIKQLAQISTPEQKKHFVIGMVKDKDIDKLLALLPTDAYYYFTNAHIPRAMHHKDLQLKAASFGLKGEGYDQVNDAIKAAKEKASQSDIIMICGSIFLVAEIERD